MNVQGCFLDLPWHRFLGIGLLAWGLIGGSTEAAELPQAFSAGSSPISPWVHRDSGFSFPSEVAGFVRGTPNQYDGTGQDVSVGYDFFQPRVVATFYVYPTAGLTLERELSRRQLEVTTAHPSAKLLSTGTIKVSPKKLDALEATYLIPVMYDGAPEPMRSLLLVGQRGDRFIEYRISFPVSGGEAAESAARNFLNDFAWP